MRDVQHGGHLGGVRRVVYGAERHQVHRMYFEDRHLGTMDYIRDAYRDDLEMPAGVLGSACAELYRRPDDNPPAAQQSNL